MKQLLIRADDLGYSDGVNYGIAKAVNKGVVKSVGVMTNMPTAMDGLKIIKKRKCMPWTAYKYLCWKTNNKSSIDSHFM